MEIPVYISSSDKLNKIRCIKAARRIEKGELIESCPIILIPDTQWDLIDHTVFDDYRYEWDEKNDCLVLGYSILANHSFEPNAEYTCNFTLQRMEYHALQPIEKDAEITINYNGDPEDKSPVDPEYTNFSR